MKADAKDYKSPDPFDVMLGDLRGRADSASSDVLAKTTYTPVIGAAQSFLIQTVRVKDEGNWLFLQYFDAKGAVRIPIPPEVTAAIARQAESLGARVRREAGRRLGKAMAAKLKETGARPAFMKNRGRKKSRPKRKKVGATTVPSRTGVTPYE